MKKRTRLLSALMITCMMTGALAGCGSTADSATDSVEANNGGEVSAITDDKAAVAQKVEDAVTESGDTIELTYWY